MNKSELIKKLREMTQAGIMDCKKALEANDYKLEVACKWLREKGIAKAATKNANKIAAEGTTWVECDAHGVALIELNTQTDFTGKSAPVHSLAKEIIQLVLKQKKADLKTLLATHLPSGQTLNEACLHLSSTTGEKIELRRVNYLAIKHDQCASIYRHHNGKISVALIFDGLAKKENEEALKKVAMHVAALNPKFLDESEIAPEWLTNERQILEKQLAQEKKPAEFATKIIKGRMVKLLAENCLLSQEFFLEPGFSVNDFLSKRSVKAVKMVRFELGEGVEKKEVNFAKEVAAQMR